MVPDTALLRWANIGVSMLGQRLPLGLGRSPFHCVLSSIIWIIAFSLVACLSLKSILKIGYEGLHHTQHYAARAMMFCAACSLWSSGWPPARPLFLWQPGKWPRCFGVLLPSVVMWLLRSAGVSCKPLIW